VHRSIGCDAIYVGPKVVHRINGTYSKQWFACWAVTQYLTSRSFVKSWLVGCSDFWQLEQKERKSFRYISEVWQRLDIFLRSYKWRSFLWFFSPAVPCLNCGTCSIVLPKVGHVLWGKCRDPRNYKDFFSEVSISRPATYCPPVFYLLMPAAAEQTNFGTLYNETKGLI